MDLIFSVLFFPFFFCLTLFCKKKKLILDRIDSSKHKKLTINKSVPLLGGFYIVSTFIINSNQENIFFLYFIISYFLIGLLSDLNILNKPLIRFFIQTIVVLSFFYFSEIKILSTRIYFLDSVLTNEIYNIIFCTFCSLILINGYNFIDGVNGLSVGYFLSLLFCGTLLFADNFSNIFLFYNYSFLIFLLILFIIIFFGIIFLGDSGSYVIGFITSVMVININYLYPEISPWFIINLVWYPCFEVLFSILRKFLKSNQSPFEADENHLHQLIYKFYKKKLRFNYANQLSSLSILTVILISLMISRLFLYNSLISILLLIFNLIMYLLIYLKLYGIFKPIK